MINIAIKYKKQSLNGEKNELKTFRGFERGI